MPPYGKDGGRTSTSYTPNLYGGTTVSSVARNLISGIMLMQVLNSGKNDLPSGVFAEFPIGGIDELWFSPDTTSPLLAIHARERFVHNIACRNRDQV